MISDAEFEWIEDQVAGDYDHLLVGTSLPWLLARALHDIQSWNEVLADGARGRRVAGWAEALRRAADLEHWAAFGRSFDRLAELFASVGRGEHSTEGRYPATVCVLSGDVHHAYIAQAHYPEPVGSAVYQLTCSPLHNFVPKAMKVAFRVAWSRAAERSTRRLLGVLAKVPPTTIEWNREAGPYFGNEIATLTMDGRRAESRFLRASPTGQPPSLTEVNHITLSQG